MLFTVIFFIISSLLAYPKVKPESPKKLDLETYHNTSNIWLRVSNYGFLGSGDDITPQYPSLRWPMYSETNYLYQGALWVGAKKYRRNEAGEKLYWLPDATDEDDVITAEDPEWTPDLEVVLDTLTTVGFDGDYDLYELLPAYNPLESSYLGSQYNEYNLHDEVLKKIDIKDYDDDNDGLIDEDNLGSPFVYNDTDSIYCFTQPTDEDMDGLIDEDCSYSGYETSIAYYYDYSPFGREGQRDYGSSTSSNHHEPLNIAVEQKVYTYPVENFADIALLEVTIHNTSSIDTLYDFTYGYYMDSDIGPEDWGSNEMALDDVASYVTGEEYEFAYAFDYDSDNGLSPGLIGLKTYNFANYNFDCWTWYSGDGPDDQEPLDPTPSGPTSNEKYWLMTGRNPDDNKYISLHDEPDAQLDDPGDTRVMYSMYGDQQGYDNPTDNSLNLPPGDSKTFYSAIVMGYDIEELKEKVIMVNEFIESGFSFDEFTGLNSIPTITNLDLSDDLADFKLGINWKSLTEPDEFRIYYKKTDEAAANWEYAETDYTNNYYELEDLDFNSEYEIKLTSIFDDVFLESATEIIHTPYIREIWPGDTNNDGIVNELDIENIGMNWYEETTERNEITYNWDSHEVIFEWEYDYGKLFADCNGDGIINIEDVMALCLNWNKTHEAGETITFTKTELQNNRALFEEIYYQLNFASDAAKIKNHLNSIFNFENIVEQSQNRLIGNYPNPFNPSTCIKFMINNEGNDVQLKIYNVRGQLVREFKYNEFEVNGNFYKITWDGKDTLNRDTASGIYFYQLIIDEKKIDTCKMLLLK